MSFPVSTDIPQLVQRLQSNLLPGMTSIIVIMAILIKAKAVPLYAMEALRWRGGIAPTYS
jgi:hypothetical protein